MTPDPSLTLTPRSGFTYQAVSEPGVALGGLGALAALAQRARRRST